MLLEQTARHSLQRTTGRVKEMRIADEAGAVTTLVLPGLDGTGALLAPFARAMPEGAQVRIASYPADEPLGYQALADRLSRDLAPGPLALVAESFAGPLALRLAAQS